MRILPAGSDTGAVPMPRRTTSIFLAVLCLFFFGITNIKGHFFIHSDLTVIIWILITALVFNRTETGKENRENERIEQGI